MDANLESAIADFHAAVTRAIVPLQTLREVRTEQFALLEKSIVKVMGLLKGQQMVSKSLLNDLFGTIQVIRNEAQEFETDRLILEDVANKIEFYFFLILKDETPDERKAGIPRVI